MKFKNKLRKFFGIKKRNKVAREKLLKLMPENSVCAEIGIWKGDFSQMVQEWNNPSSYHLIDPWKYQTDFGDRLFGGSSMQGQDMMDQVYQDVVDRFAANENIKIHRGFSDEVSHEFEDEYFDWVYIDGNHYYEFVLNDLNHYFPKVKKGGFLTGDDYMWTSIELNKDRPVKRAVNDFIKEKGSEIIGFKKIGSQFLIQKA